MSDNSTDLPAACPVRALGRNGDTYYFLSAAGQFMRYTAGQLEKSANLISLFSYADQDPLEALKQLGPPRRNRGGGGKDVHFNPLDAARRLMGACAALPLFDPATQIRNFGTWRGEGGAPLVHAGERILHPSGIEDRAGQMIADAIYPATHGRAEPADDEPDPDDLFSLRSNIAEGWRWKRAIDADVLFGWVGQAALGAYPAWRSHIWISGPGGSGKSTAARIASTMLGGMSNGLKEGSTEAAVRSITNGMAIARMFDEAEQEAEDGSVEKVIKLFRLMSDVNGATIERGTADHAGIQFRLHGAGLMASVIPGSMTPADRSRWVMLEIAARKAADDPMRAAARLAHIETEAARLGPMIWRRMLQQAGDRWDPAYLEYSSLVQTLGGDARAGATIGAILAGWDLLLYEGAIDDERRERAVWIAEFLIDDVKAAAEEGEGEQCLRRILAHMVQKDSGGAISVNELIRRNLAKDPEQSDRALLGRAGLRIMDAGTAHTALFVHGPAHPVLERALQNSRWRAGGHRKALLMLDGVEPSAGPIRVAGNKVRGVMIPKQHLPTEGD